MKKVLKYVIPAVLILFAAFVIILFTNPSVLITRGPGGKGIFGRPNDGPLTGFSFRVTDAFGRSGYKYEVKDGTVYYSGDWFRDAGVLSMPADPGLTDQLYDIYLRHKAYRWDGYDKYNTRVLDGGGFRLRMEFADGKVLTCEGENARPKGFSDFSADVRALLSPYGEAILEEAGI